MKQLDTNHSLDGSITQPITDAITHINHHNIMGILWLRLQMQLNHPIWRDIYWRDIYLRK